jgi:transcriptional regulator with XRE-family HTH domain
VSDLGHRIRELRQLRGVTQAELARRTGVTASAVSQWEGKQVTGLKGSTLVRVAQALGVEASDLMNGAEPTLSLSPDEDELLQAFRALPYGHRVLAVKIIKALG